jgi:DNA repair exonuclease SbcCD ATPase subunit/DNA repair exonuclease SbcCD nuclease subunit
MYIIDKNKTTNKKTFQTKMALRIAHLADIHIKHDKLEEFDEVLPALYDSLKKHGVNLIIVCGDIYHNKTIATGEEICYVNKFLCDLCKIAKTIVIEGNHDVDVKSANKGLLVNIEKNIDFVQNGIMFTNTGIYDGFVDNVIFGVVGARLRKDEFNLRNVLAISAQKETKFKLGLFHEDFSGATYENGRVVATDKLTHLDFEGYDLVLGGHIHLQQIVRAENPIIAYAGSLKQQNFGETFGDHGYMLWNIDRIDNKWKIDRQDIVVENPFGYLTIDYCYPYLYEMGEIKLPDYGVGHYRIICGESESKAKNNIKFANFCKALADKYGSHKLTTIKYAGELLSRVEDETKGGNVEVPEKIIEFGSEILEYLKTTKFKDERIYDEVLKLHNTYYAHNTTSRQIVELVQMDFTNLYCFSRGSINFKSLEGVVSGVISNNESGKSSIINILLFALTHTMQTSSRRDIVRHGCSVGYVDLQFNIGTVVYRIFKKICSVSHNDQYILTRNGTVIANESKKVIEQMQEIIGNTESIINTSFLQQNEINSLITATKEKRKEFLTKSLNLNIFNEIAEQVKTPLDEAKINYLKYTFTSDEDVEKTKNIFEQYTKQIAELESNIKLDEDSLTNLKIQFTNAQSVYDSAKEKRAIEIDKYSQLRDTIAEHDNVKMIKSRAYEKFTHAQLKSAIAKHVAKLVSIVDIGNPEKNQEEIKKLENEMSFGDNGIPKIKEEIDELHVLHKKEEDVCKKQIMQISERKFAPTEDLINKLSKLDEKILMLKKQCDVKINKPKLNTKSIKFIINDMVHDEYMDYHMHKEVREFEKFEELIAGDDDIDIVDKLLSMMEQLDVDVEDVSQIIEFFDSIPKDKSSEYCQRCGEVDNRLHKHTADNNFHKFYEKIKNISDEHHTKLRRYREEVEHQNKRIDEIKCQIDEYEKLKKGQIQNAEQIFDKQKELDIQNCKTSLEKILRKLEEQKFNKTEEIRRRQLESDAIAKKHKELCQKQLQFKDAQESIVALGKILCIVEQTLNDLNNSKLTVELNALSIAKSAFYDCKEKIANSKTELIKLRYESESINAKIKKMLDENSLFLDAKFKFDCYKAYYDTIGSRGVAVILLNKKIKQLESLTNQILSQCSNKNAIIEFSTDPAKGYELTYSTDTAKNLKLACASGFRKTAIGIAISIAIWKLNNAPVLNALFLDETLAPCDKINIQNMIDLIIDIINTQHGMPKILFVITHDPNIKSIIEDNCINIVKGNDGNYIEHCEPMKQLEYASIDIGEMKKETPEKKKKDPNESPEKKEKKLEKNVEKNKEFTLQPNGKYLCVCGKEMTKASMGKHLQSAFHMNFVSNQ